MRAPKCHRNTKHSQWETHPLDFLFILWGMEGEMMLYAYICIVCLDLLHPFATLCSSRGKKPICAQATTGGSPSPSLLFLENPETLEKMKSPQQTSAPHQEQAQTLSVRSSQNQQRLPSSYKNLLGFQPFYEAFQQIYGSSCSQLHYMNSSNASIKNSALPPLT